MATPILKGAMAHVRLASAVQMLLNDGASGRLEIRTPEGEGWLSLSGGTLSRARFGGLAGGEAVIGLLLCREGEFELVEDHAEHRKEAPGKEPGSEGPDPAVVRADPFSLLMESLRVQDHWEALATRTLPQIDSGTDSAFLQALRAGARVADAARTAGLHPLQALAELERVPSAGLVRPAPQRLDAVLEEPAGQTPVPERELADRGLKPLPLAEEGFSTAFGPETGPGTRQGEPPGPPDAAAGALGIAPGFSNQRTFLILLELGTEAFRAQRLEEAERHWRQAERLYPGDRRVRLNLNVLDARRRLAGDGRPDGSV